MTPTAPPRPAELFSVGPTTAELFIDGEVVVLEGLEPSSEHLVEGIAFSTLEDIGEVRSTIATMNDVHFGEEVCGRVAGVEGSGISLPAGQPPYPVVMNEAVVAEAAMTTPSLVVVKGDLTDEGRPSEIAAFRQLYRGTFGTRLLYVRGNHDCYEGSQYADWPVQVSDLDGARVVVLDTARRFTVGGTLDAAQIDAVDALAQSTTLPVLLFGHHPLSTPEHPLTPANSIDEHAGALLLECLGRHDNLIAYLAGHTHRCRRQVHRGTDLIEVACVKDFPGAWAQYLIGTKGITQVLHRARRPDAVAWAEQTRHLFDGYYGAYALGELSDRSFLLGGPTASTTSRRG